MKTEQIAETWTGRKATDEARHVVSCLVCRERLRPANDQKLYAVKNALTRQFVHVLVNGESLESKLGWSRDEILWSALIKDSARKGPPMSEEVKAKLRENGEKKKAENKLKRLVRANTPARLAEGEQEREDQDMATKKRGKKAEIAKGKKRGSTIFDFPATSVVRWMSKNGLDFDQVKSALKAVGASNALTDGTIRAQIYHGKKGSRGEPATLTAEQQKILRDAAKTIKVEKTKKDVKKTVKKIDVQAVAGIGASDNTAA